MLKGQAKPPEGSDLQVCFKLLNFIDFFSKFLVCAQECLGPNKDHARSNNISHVPKGQAKSQKGGGFLFS